MKVENYTLWKSAAITYWHDYIDTNHMGDAGLKAQATSLMGAFDQPIADYDASVLESPFIGVLFSLANYVTSKYAITTPDVTVPNLSVFPTGSAKDLFSYWVTDLPDYEGFFTVSGEVPSLTLENTESYDAAIEEMGGYLEADQSRFENVTGAVVAAVRQQAAYILFSGKDANIIRNEFDLKDFILNDFGVQDVLDEFEWSIKGLNS